jgi:hypothetical protein
VSDTDNTGSKQRPAHLWKPGQSGNPAGRPKGSLNETTRLVQALLDGDAEDIVRKAIELAKSGDGPVLRAVLDRIAPPRKDGPISLDLPPIESLADAKAASSAVLAAVACGDITPGEGASVMALLTNHKAIVEATDFEARLAALEERQQQ